MRSLCFIFVLILILGYFKKTYLWVWSFATLPLPVCRQMVSLVLDPSYSSRMMSLEKKYLLELKSLRNLSVRYQEQESKMKRLEAILNLQTEIKNPSVVARVVGLTLNPSRCRFIIDRGRQDQIDSYFPVVCSYGVVGIIGVVGEKKSEVILLTDPSFSMSVRFQNQRSLALLSGQKGRTCSLFFIDKDVIVQEGDPVITSGIGGIFPQGFFVGSVLYSKRDSKDMYQQALLFPNAPFEQIEEVIILLPQEASFS